MTEGQRHRVEIETSPRSNSISVSDRRSPAKLAEIYAKMPVPRVGSPRRIGGAGVFRRFNNKHIKTNRHVKLLKQIVISIIIFAFIFGLQQINLPFVNPAKEGLRYLLTTETNFTPIFQKVVQTSMKWSNVDWPMLQSWGVKETKPIITTISKGFSGELPVSGAIIQSYGWAFDSQKQMFNLHRGIDIETEKGADVTVVKEGTIVRTYTDESGNKGVIVRHDESLMTQYINLSDIQVTESEKVKQGQVLGKVTKPQSSNKVHLHFEVLKYGKPVDPLTVLGI